MNKRGLNIGLEASYLGCLGLIIPTIVIDVSVITFVLKLLDLTSIPLVNSIILFIIGILVLGAVVYYQFGD